MERHTIKQEISIKLCTRKSKIQIELEICEYELELLVSLPIMSRSNRNLQRTNSLRIVPWDSRTREPLDIIIK